MQLWLKRSNWLLAITKINTLPALVVQFLDSAIQQINQYLVGNQCVIHWITLIFFLWIGMLFWTTGARCGLYTSFLIPYSGIFLWGFGLQPSLLQQKNRKQLLYILGLCQVSHLVVGWLCDAVESCALFLICLWDCMMHVLVKDPHFTLARHQVSSSSVV